MPDFDLFGREVLNPINGDQIPLFHEPTPAPPVKTPGETEADRRIARKFANTPTEPMFPPGPKPQNPPAEKKPKRPPRDQRSGLRRAVEAELKRRGIPYVDVTEARRALFEPRTIRISACFHFVIYSQSGSNWLLLCGEAGEENRQSMIEWENIFGDGFKAVFAVECAAGIVYKTLSGERLDLSECHGRKESADGGE